MYHEGGENQMHSWSLPAKPEDLAGLFILKLFAEFTHFFSTFLQHEKVYSDDRFLVKVRSCGHFLVSAKPVT